MGIGTKLPAAIKIVRVCAILHNMGRTFKDDTVEDGPDEDAGAGPGDGAATLQEEALQNEAGVRTRGQMFRDDLVDRYFS